MPAIRHRHGSRRLRRRQHLRPFFTTLVVTTVVTSQGAGFWLDYVLRKNWPLLSGADLRRRGIEPEPDEELPQVLKPAGINTNGTPYCNVTAASMTWRAV